MKTCTLTAGLVLTGVCSAYAGSPLPGSKVDTLCILKAFQTTEPFSYEFRNEVVDSVRSSTQFSGTIFLARKENFYRLADSFQEQIIGLDAMVFVDHAKKSLRVFRFENEKSRLLTFEQYTHNAIADSLMRLMMNQAQIKIYAASKRSQSDSLVIKPTARYPIQEMRFVLKRESCWIENMQVLIPYKKKGRNASPSHVYTRGTAWNYQKGIPQKLKGLFENKAQVVPFLVESYKNYKLINL